MQRIIRKSLLKKFRHFGERSSYDSISSKISDYSNIYIGNDVYIWPNSVMSADTVIIRIGDDTIIGPGLCIMAGDHEYSISGIFYHSSPKGRNEDVTIGRNVWIGANVTILKGVTIGDASIIGAGSVVVGSIPRYAIAVGNPCKTIKWRFEDEDRMIHEQKVISNLIQQ